MGRESKDMNLARFEDTFDIVLYGTVGRKDMQTSRI